MLAFVTILITLILAVLLLIRLLILTLIVLLLYRPSAYLAAVLLLLLLLLVLFLLFWSSFDLAFVAVAFAFVPDSAESKARCFSGRPLQAEDYSPSSAQLDRRRDRTGWRSRYRLFSSKLSRG